MAEEREIPIHATPYSSPMHNYGGSILMLTNPDNEIYKLELSMRGERVNKDGEAIKVGQPLMNEQGINSIIAQVQALVNQVTIMSNLDDNDIPILMDFLGDSLAKDLMLNRVNYEMTDAAARDKIFFEALSTTFVCLRRAYKEGDKRFWKGSQQEITTRVENGQKKGLLAGMWGSS